MAKISRDMSVGTLHPRETIYQSGTLGVLGAEIVTNADGAASVSLDLRGTFVASIEVSGSIDGVNWTMIPLRLLNSSSMTNFTVTSASIAGFWVGRCAPFRLIRARATAYTSGAVIATLAADTAPLDDSLVGMITPSIVTSTAASGVALTLTLPAPSAGLRHVITYLEITRYAAAVLTASATPTIVTTTNLPGLPAITFPADAAALGTTFAWREDFSFPVAASAHATAITINCPAVPGVIWRATGGYFIGA
jgi:hypothetical protein